MTTHAHRYRVIQFAPLTDSIAQLIAAPDTDQAIEYAAGQYVMLCTPDGEERPFSIANAPLGTGQLEFHIRHTADNQFTEALFAQIQDSGCVDISGPLGDCVLHDDTEAPILMIAGGTGFAPMKALIEHALTHHTARDIHLYWGAKNRSELYFDDLTQQWDSHVQWFHYTPVLDNEEGKSQLVATVTKNYSDLSKHDVYLAGPGEMVTATYQQLSQFGLKKEQTFSDML